MLRSRTYLDLVYVIVMLIKYLSSIIFLSLIKTIESKKNDGATFGFSHLVSTEVESALNIIAKGNAVSLFFSENTSKKQS